MAGPIDTTGSLPRLRVVALLGSSAGLVVFAWLHGLMSFLRNAGQGVANSLNGFRTFMYSLDGTDSVVSLILSGITQATSVMWQANAAWLSDTFGVFAQPVAVLEIMVVIYALLTALQKGAQRIREGLG